MIKLDSGFEQRTFCSPGNQTSGGVVPVNGNEQRINIERQFDKNEAPADFLSKYASGLKFASRTLGTSLGLMEAVDYTGFYPEPFAKKVVGAGIGKYGVSLDDPKSFQHAPSVARHFGEFLPIYQGQTEDLVTQIVYGSKAAINTLNALHSGSLNQAPRRNTYPLEINLDIPAETLREIIAVVCIPYSVRGGGVFYAYTRTHLLTNPKVVGENEKALMEVIARYVGTVTSNMMQPLRPISEL